MLDKGEKINKVRLNRQKSYQINDKLMTKGRVNVAI